MFGLVGGGGCCSEGGGGCSQGGGQFDLAPSKMPAHCVAWATRLQKPG